MTATRHTSRDLPDHELVAAVANGDISAFEHLYDRHARAVYGLALRLAGRGGQAEDIAQEAFLTLWRSAAAYRADRGSVATWLLTVTRNLAIDLLRRRAAEDRALAQAAGRSARPDPDAVADVALGGIEAARLHAALPTLPDEQRTVIALTFLGGRSGREAALLQGIPEGTAKSRIRLGLDRLRTALAPAW